MVEEESWVRSESENKSTIMVAPLVYVCVSEKVTPILQSLGTNESSLLKIDEV